MAIDINIPSQVKNYANLAAFPATGTLKTIFIANDTNKTYRWTGSVYVEISGTDTSSLVPTSRTLTINGTTQDLSADRTFTISTGITIGTTAITSGTVGRVLFEGTGNVVSESANLFWDNTNGRLGIGTSTPTFRLEVQGGDVRFANGLTIGTAGSTGWQFSSNTVTLIQNGFIGVDFANGREFSFTNTSFSTTYLKLAPTTGNVLINTTTDAGFKFDVNGTARVVGSMLVQGMTIGLGGGAIANSVAIGKEALQNNTTYQNCAVGYRALYNNTGGDNTAIGAFYAMFANTTGGRNTGIGTYALNGNTTGQWNSALGYNTSSGNFDGSVILGYGAAATASNQFAVGSSAVNAGSVTTEVNASTQVWNVIINGVARKILLA